MLLLFYSNVICGYANLILYVEYIHKEIFDTLVNLPGVMQTLNLF